MTSNEHAFLAPGWVRCALGLALLTLLGGCAGAPSTGASWSQRPTPEQVRAVLERTAQPTQPAAAVAQQ